MRRGDTGPAGAASLVLVLLLQAACLASAVQRTPPASPWRPSPCSPVASPPPSRAVAGGAPGTRRVVSARRWPRRFHPSRGLVVAGRAGPRRHRRRRSPLGAPGYAAGLVVVVGAAGAWLVVRHTVRRLGGITGRRHRRGHRAVPGCRARGRVGRPPASERRRASAAAGSAGDEAADRGRQAATPAEVGVGVAAPPRSAAARARSTAVSGRAGHGCSRPVARARTRSASSGLRARTGPCRRVATSVPETTPSDAGSERSPAPALERREGNGPGCRSVRTSLASQPMSGGSPSALVGPGHDGARGTDAAARTVTGRARARRAPHPPGRRTRARARRAPPRRRASPRDPTAPGSMTSVAPIRSTRSTHAGRVRCPRRGRRPSPCTWSGLLAASSCTSRSRSAPRRRRATAFASSPAATVVSGNRVVTTSARLTACPLSAAWTVVGRPGSCRRR